MSSSAAPSWSNPHETPTPSVTHTNQEFYSEGQQQQPSQSQQSHQSSHQASDDVAFLSQPYSTLDEPVIETIMRDVKEVSAKLKVVLMPLSNYNANLSHLYAAVNVHTEDETGANVNGQDPNVNVNGPNSDQEETNKILSTLKNWDLFGPLIVCLLLSIALSLRAPSNQTSAVFAAVFCSMWMGSAIVTVNAKLLGASLGFFQSVCILGYSVFPFCISALIILMLQKTFLGHVWLDIVWVLIGFVWATRASVLFIGQFVPKERRFLAVFPVFFYYTLLGWLVLLF